MTLSSNANDVVGVPFDSNHGDGSAVVGVVVSTASTAGNDILSGQNGNDTIFGREGDDTMLTSCRDSRAKMGGLQLDVFGSFAF